MSIRKGLKTIAGAPLTTEWGAVSGNIADQEDLQRELSSKLSADSPALTGTPTAPTVEVGLSNNQIATTKFVNDSIDAALQDVDALPSQIGHEGQFLKTNGTYAFWQDLDNIFWANYGTTTFEEIYNQSKAGRLVLCNYSDYIFILSDVGISTGISPGPHIFSSFFNNTEINIKVTPEDTWSFQSHPIIPLQTGNSGKFLTTNGTTASWANVPTEIPSQSGQSGKFLTTNGSSVSWATVDAFPSQAGNNGKVLTTNGSTVSWTSLPTVDQTFNGSSSNAQSGIAITNAKFLRNLATGVSSLAILGESENAYTTTIGAGASTIGAESIAIGANATTNGADSIALGTNASTSAARAIQIGEGTNSTPTTLNIGFGTLAGNVRNYTLLNGSNGLIPDERLSSNIARTSAIQTYHSGSGITIDSNNNINHSNSVTGGTAGTSSNTSGSTLAVPYVTYDNQGHITETGTHTHTVTGFLTQSDVTSTYSETGTAPVNGTAVASAISGKVDGNTAITGATKCKITYDSKGLVTSGADLEASDIPTLTLDKIPDITATAAELNVLDGITASTAELNFTDGVTSNIQTQLNNKVTKNDSITGATKCKITYDSKGLVTSGADLTTSDIPSLPLSKINDVTATASEVNVLDGITASTDELNILDGATLTTTELNYVDGVTSNIQTQLDNKVAQTNTASKVYGTDASGNQTTYDYTALGKVDDVKVGTESVVTNKIANLGTMAGETATDYSKTSEFEDIAFSGSWTDLSNTPTTIAGYGITDAYTKTEIDGKLTSAMHFKGTVATYSALPSTGQQVGDMYNVLDAGSNYAWDGNAWDKLSETIDLSPYDNHIANTNNPHSVTKAQVGLGNVDNTSDANKPISTATQGALDNKVDKVNTASQVYVTDSSKNQTSIGYTTDNTASTIVQRDGNSQINVAQTPTSNTHAASKKYVDDSDATKVDKVNTASRVYGTDSSGNQTTYDYSALGKVDDVKVGTESVVTNKIANLGTMAGESKDDYEPAISLTESRALISNASGKVAVSDVTSTELGYLDGVTSNIQTQLDNKVTKNNAITGSTKCKITYDSKGLVTSGADLESSDIPSLLLSKISDVTATASEVNVLDGITASTTELNVLDGITATTTELNYVDGVTSNIQTQLDNKLEKNDSITGATKCKITYDSKGLVTAGADLSANDIPSLSLSKINDVTATASEVNVLDGITTTTTELNYVGGVTSSIQDQLDNKVAKNDAITGATKCKITYDSKGLVTAGADLSANDIPSLPLSKINDVTATAAELNYVGGVTSSIQDQLDNKVESNTAITGATHTKITYDSKGLVTAGANLSASDIPNLTLDKISDVTATAEELNVLDGITASTAELNYVDGVTSNIQTQLNNKVASNNAITGATHTKITYDSKGLVTSGSDLTASDIPSITLDKISDITATAAELNVLDGITASTTELNYTDGVTSNIQTQLDNKVVKNDAITAGTHTKITYDSKGLVTSGEDLTANDIPSLTLSKISDVTATANELNTLDGITASTTELNYVDGVTSNIQTQLDNKVAQTSEVSKVYGTNSAGVQSTYDIGDLTNLVDDVKVANISVVTNKIANLGSMAGESTTDYTKNSGFKTINSESIIGSGDISLQTKLSGTNGNVVTYTGTDGTLGYLDFDTEPTQNSNKLVKSGPIWTELNKKINYTDIVNDVSTGGTSVPLSAEQGKILDQKITSAQQSTHDRGVVLNALTSQGQNYTITNATVNTAGSNYIVGDALFLVSDLYIDGIITVTSVNSSGAITGITLAQGGAFTTNPSGTAVSFIGGSGSGAKFTLTTTQTNNSTLNSISNPAANDFVTVLQDELHDNLRYVWKYADIDGDDTYEWIGGYPITSVERNFTQEPILAAELSSNAVTTVKIADNNVTADKLSDDSIVARHITDGAIVNAHIGSAAAIEQSKIANLTTDLAERVQTTTTGSQVYGTTASGTQTTITYGSTVTASNIVQRDSNSQILVPITPTNDSHATSKNYVDAGLSNKQESDTAVTHTKNTAAGSATQPVYVNTSGVATPITYTIESSVPSGAVFTDTTYSQGTGISINGTTINHSNSVTAGTAGTSSATSGSTLAVPYITYDAQGHITETGTHTHTVTGFLTQSDVTSTYSATGTAPVNGTAVASAISNKVDGNAAITGATHTKITYDSKGLVTSGSDITLSDVTDVTATATEVNYLSGVTSAVQTQLNNKAADSAVVHLAGAETITGVKSFNETLQLKNNLSFRSYGSNDSGRLQFRAQPSDNVIRGTVAITDGYSTSGSGYTGFVAQMVAREGSTSADPFNTMRVSNKGIEYIKEANDGTITGQYVVVDSNGIIPSDRLATSGSTGQVLTKTASGQTWQTIDALPSQSGQNGKYLTTNGSTASWATIPAVNNATLTIQKNGTTVNTFTANSSTDVTANITVPTTVAELSDSSDYALASSVLDYYGTCTTAAGTQAKVVTCSGFTLKTGASVRVKFTYGQTYNGNPTLNVNGTGAISVKYVGESNADRYYWYAGEVVAFTYDGTYWIMEDAGLATTSYYGITKLATSATSTSSSVAATPASINNLVLNMIEPYSIYSTSETYAVGDRVRYSYNVWECNTAIETEEAWTEAHWTKIDPIQTQIDSKVEANSAITGATKCKITYDSKGLVTGGSDLSASDIPDLSSTYQSVLVSGTNIKTINNQSILGSGNIEIQGGTTVEAYTAAEVQTIWDSVTPTSN